MTVKKSHNKLTPNLFITIWDINEHGYPRIFYDFSIVYGLLCSSELKNSVYLGAMNTLQCSVVWIPLFSMAKPAPKLLYPPLIHYYTDNKWAWKPQVFLAILH